MAMRHAVLCLFCCTRFQYILQAATSPATLLNEETQTYLNQGISTSQQSVKPAIHTCRHWRPTSSPPVSAHVRRWCGLFVKWLRLRQIISLLLPFYYQWQLDCTECDDMAFVGQSYEIKMRRLGTICNNNEQQYRVSTISCIFIMRIELKVLPMIDWLIDWFFKRLPH